MYKIVTARKNQLESILNEAHSNGWRLHTAQINSVGGWELILEERMASMGLVGSPEEPAKKAGRPKKVKAQLEGAVSSEIQTTYLEEE